MYVASLILGLSSIVLSWIPFLNVILALVALIISIIAVVRKKENKKGKGMAVAGLSTSCIAIIISIIFCIAVINFAIKIPGFIDNILTEISEELDIVYLPNYAEAETMLKSKYLQVSIKNKNNEYTGYINSSTEEYTDRLNGIEVDDYYENYLKQNRYDYDVFVSNLGEPIIDKD